MKKPDLTTTDGVLDWLTATEREEPVLVSPDDCKIAAEIATAMRMKAAWEKWKAQFGADYLTEMGEYDGFELASDLTRAEKEPEK